MYGRTRVRNDKGSIKARLSKDKAGKGKLEYRQGRENAEYSKEEVGKKVGQRHSSKTDG